MKIGLLTGDPAAVVTEARVAEQAGFDYLASGEHLFFHGPTPNAFAQLAAAAAVTSTIGLVSTVALLPLYPAALAAKLAVSLDGISGGRFELGVGAGGEFPREFAASGVDVGDRFRRMEEGLRIVRALFSGDRVSIDGEFASVQDLRLQPPPVRPGGPPIWLGGRKRAATRRAGRYADVWMPFMTDPAGLARSLGQVRDAAVAAERPAEAVSGAVFVWTCVDADAAWARSTGVAVVSKAYAQDFAPLADRYLLVGSPAQVLDRVAQFGAAGAERIILAPACPPAERDRLVETIATAVLPELDKACTTTSST